MWNGWKVVHLLDEENEKESDEDDDAPITFSGKKKSSKSSKKKTSPPEVPSLPKKNSTTVNANERAMGGGDDGTHLLPLPVFNIYSSLLSLVHSVLSALHRH
ncbi:hypothetical protein L1887_28902 [Cichorium endivia]|nr:hypothetical protein L1887_28902 [Cichorium endivia]